MYSYIKGKVVDKNPAYVVIECNGIGYVLNISLNTYSQLKNKDQFKLFTHFSIRTEATTPVGFTLYGFANEQERHLFRLLISVSGVGSSTAMLMLSSLAHEKIYDAIVSNDAAVLQSVKGIGAKSAQRIILDLKDKLEKDSFAKEFLGVSHNRAKDEALSGLMILGFKNALAEKAIDAIQKKHSEDVAVEELIKEALKIL